MHQKREAVQKQDQWDVDALYPSMQAWEKAFTQVAHAESKPRWPHLETYKGRLGEGPELVQEALEHVLTLERELSKLYTYAHLRHDEEITLNTNKVAFNQILALYQEFQQETAWFSPELLTLSTEQLESYMHAPVLKPYSFYIEKIARMKPHTLPPEQEELLALSNKALIATYKAFSAINDADFKFGEVKDAKGAQHPLTHASYGLYLHEHDRTLRKNAFEKMHGHYADYENTLSELLNGQVQGHLFDARAHRYESCLEAALFPKNIEKEVYTTLIDAVSEEIDALHTYIHLRQNVMQQDPLHLYDMYVPLTEEVDIKMSYDEAVAVVIESVAPLGAEYQNILKKGLESDRWVDKFENANKRSGAYSSGCYDSRPYILMNYKGILRDVFTLAHEAGHSMHSYMSHHHQPYQYSSYPIFLAEVASTFNEDLLTDLLLKRARSLEEKIFLVNQKIEDIRSTFFRQTLFAEFELLIHEMAEQNIPLTPTALKEAFRTLNRKYFGDTVTLDPISDIEWARIPHFYYQFYVYQYATGISAALALSEKVRGGGDSEREAYLGFLKSGSSRYPIDILKGAGVDMTSAEPVKATIGKFRRLVEELKALLDERRAKVGANV